MGSWKAGILASVVVGPNSWILHETSFVLWFHQTSKAVQPLVLVEPVLLKLLHSVAAHCHLKQENCSCILSTKLMQHINNLLYCCQHSLFYCNSLLICNTLLICVWYIYLYLCTLITVILGLRHRGQGHSSVFQCACPLWPLTCLWCEDQGSCA